MFAGVRPGRITAGAALIAVGMALTALLAFAPLVRAQVQMGLQGPGWQHLPPSERVVGLSHCRERARYQLTFQDGSIKPWAEYDLRLKIDSTKEGPPAGMAMLLPAGGQGDRAYLVFGSAESLKAMLVAKC